MDCTQRYRRRHQGRAPSRLIQAGYSIYDLMVTSVVAGILSLGAVSMASMVQDGHITTTVNQFMGELNLARSEAIKRGSATSICTSAAGSVCLESRDWNAGWIIFSDINGNGILETDDSILRVQQTGTLKSVRFGAWGPGTGRWVTYEADGSTKQNGTFTFCDERGTKKAKAVILLGTGRPRVSSVNASNGPLSCP
jgi:type IV fimbrial biogenesis protein FimT